MHQLSELLAEIGGDAVLAVFPALARVALGHLAEDRGLLSVAWWKRGVLLIGSVSLAVWLGHASREMPRLVENADVIVGAAAFSAQDIFMVLVARSRRALRDLKRPPKHHK